jgi:hypothetical protein
MRKALGGFLLSLSLIFIYAPVSRAQTNDFTYQGRLLTGTTPATGSYDFEFLTAANGSPIVSASEADHQ